MSRPSRILTIVGSCGVLLLVAGGVGAAPVVSPIKQPPAQAAADAAASDSASDSPVKVTPGDTGYAVEASGARLEDVLQAIADEAGFDIEMRADIERKPVEVHVGEAPLEEVLRRVLRRRNYTIMWEDTGEGLAISRVRVLQPPSPVQPAQQVQQVRRVQDAVQRASDRQQQLRAQQARAQRVRQQRLQRARRIQQARRMQQARRAAAQRAAAQSTPLRRQLLDR